MATTRLFGSIGLGLACLCAAAGMAGEPEPVKEPDRVFRKLDENMDGKLTQQEFLKLALRAKDAKAAEKRLRKIYAKVDPKGVGITPERFRMILVPKTKAKKKE